MRIISSIVSFLLAGLVLLASSNFYITSHSCGGRVNKIAFLEKADGCGHALMPPCHRAMMKGCCEDDVITHDAQDLKVESKLLLSFTPSFIAITSPVVIAELIPSSSLQAGTPHFDYDTPPRSGDLTVALHVFLI